VDKPDVRLVVHADIPGSLENYLQEAGRAGRDQDDARCVLLYDPQDIETQFGLSERSRLSYKDIQQILKKLRFEAAKRKGGQVVITAGEILQDETVQTSFESDDRDAETKVVTAIAWLERGQFLRRQENHTKVFPAKLCLTEEEAAKRLDNARLPHRRLEEFRAILRYLYSADADERINTDQLMLLTGQTNEEVSAALRQLEALGLLENDSQLTLYLRHGIAGASSERLQRCLALEAALFKVLRELAPDADDGSWQDVNLPPLTAALRARCDQPELLPLHVSRLLHSLALDRDGDSQQRSSFELRQVNRDHLKLRIRGGYSWSQVEGLGDKRRRIAAAVLPFLFGKLPPRQRGKDLLVQTTFGELQHLLAADLELSTTIKPEQRLKALEHVLLYLHHQEVLTLNHGMTVMRRAMTIDINPDKQGQRYVKDDFQRLDEHYRERRTEVLNQYQRRADLVPNLVATVKGEASFEQETLTRVIEARAKATAIQVTPEMLQDPQAMQRFQAAQGELGGALSRLLVVAERYPDLKANQAFGDLRVQLEGTENRITVARNRYIKAVQAYNVTVRSLPSNLTAMLLGYHVKPNFSVENEQQISTAPKVDFAPAPDSKSR